MFSKSGIRVDYITNQIKIIKLLTFLLISKPLDIIYCECQYYYDFRIFEIIILQIYF